MNHPLQLMCASITSQIVDVTGKLDLAESASGSSFLTLKVGDYQVIVDWRHDRGFGLTAGRDGEYGEGPDETMLELATAQGRVIWLLQHREITSPPIPSRSIGQAVAGGSSPLPPVHSELRPCN